MTKQEKSIIRRLKKIQKELGELDRTSDSEVNIIIGYAENGNGELHLYCDGAFVQDIVIKLLREAGGNNE